jgi:hypothetical protein
MQSGDVSRYDTASLNKRGLLIETHTANTAPPRADQARTDSAYTPVRTNRRTIGLEESKDGSQGPDKG